MARSKKDRSDEKRSKRRPRRTRSALLFVLMLAALLWFAPAIAANTPLRGMIVSQAAADLEGSLTCEGMSLGWFSPIRLSQITVADSKGEPLATIPQIVGEHTLFQLACDRTHLGSWKIEQPQLKVALRNDGSNIEDVLAPLLAKESSSPITCTIEIVEGNVEILNEASGDSLRCESVNLKLEVGHGTGPTLQAQLEARTSDGRAVGEISIVVALPDDSEAASNGRNRFTLTASQLPLRPLSPCVARFLNEAEMAGLFHGEINAEWGGEESAPSRLAVEGAVDSFQFSAPDWLGEDRIDLPKVAISGAVESENGRWKTDEVTIDSDILVGSANGIVPIDLFGTVVKEGIEGATLPRDAMNISATIDLVRLSHMLPRTLHMRDDAEIVSGTIVCTAQMDQEQEFSSLSIVIETANVQATASGRGIIWEEPIRFHLNANDASGEVTDITLACRSSFLTADGSFNQNRGSFSAECDLDQLAEMLRPLVHFGEFQFAGRITAEGDVVVSHPQINLSNLTLVGEEILMVGKGCFIEEPRMKIESSLVIDLEKRQIRSPTTTLASSTLAFQADNLRLEFPQDKPIAFAATIDYRADLDRLMRWTNDPRLQPTTHLTGLVSGEIDASINGGITRFRATSDIENAEIYRFEAPEGSEALPVADTNQWNKTWSEPRIHLVIAGEYGGDASSLHLDTVDVNLPWLHLASEAAVSSSGEQPNISVLGQMDYDLAIVAERFQEWLSDSVQLTGQQVHQFSLQGPLKSNKMSDVDLDQNFPLISPELSGHAAVGWETANLFGLPIGESTIDARLADGVVHIVPLDMQLSQGRFRCTPRIELNAEPPMIIIDEGMILERVRLEPSMCQTWIKYVAPLLAEATVAEGDLSVTLGGARLPLFDPPSGEVDGTLTLHAGRIGPGPMAQPFVVVASQVKAILQGNPLQGVGDSSSTWIELTEQDVEFRLVDGRVYHQGLTILVGDVAITTSGSVGLDQSIDMVAQIPLRREWVGQERYLAAIEGKVLSIPIRGTLDSPQIDAEVVQQLAGQLLEGAAQSLLENEIQNQLQRLFGQ